MDIHNLHADPCTLHCLTSQGTHIAGTILALGGNGQGVVGIIRNGQVGVHIMRLYDDDGVTWAGDSLKAVYDCVANGANVVSMRCEKKSIDINLYMESHSNVLPHHSLS
jgi:subtilisin family serine protease